MPVLKPAEPRGCVHGQGVDEDGDHHITPCPLCRHHLRRSPSAPWPRKACQFPEWVCFQPGARDRRDRFSFPRRVWESAVWPTQAKHVGHYLPSAFFPSALALLSVSTHVPFLLTLSLLIYVPRYTGVLRFFFPPPFWTKSKYKQTNRQTCEQKHPVALLLLPGERAVPAGGGQKARG